MRVPLVMTLLVALCACAGPGEPDHPGAEDCERLREHVADLRLAAADSGGRVSEDDRRQHGDALRAAMVARGDDCRSRTASEVACQLNAADLDSLRACASTTDPEN
jgi:hypothetical protein